MTYRGAELARSARREQLERERKDLSREKEQLDRELSRLDAKLDESRAQARVSLRQYSWRDRLIALAYLVFLNTLFFSVGLANGPAKWVLLVTAVVLVLAGGFYARRKAGNKEQHKAADAALREQIVDIARVRAPPAERDEGELEEIEERESPRQDRAL